MCYLETLLARDGGPLLLHMGRVAVRMVMLLCRAECEDALWTPDGFENMGLVFFTMRQPRQRL